MEIFKIITLGITASILIVFIKRDKPEIAILIAIAGGVMLLSLIAEYIGGIFSGMTEIINKTNMDNKLFLVILKITGIGYLTEFASNICDDFGTKNIGDKIQLAGKIIILFLAMPIINSVIELIVSIIK